MGDSFIVFWKGQVLVNILDIIDSEFIPSKILDWYAEKYGFDRKYLTYATIHTIKYAPTTFNQPHSSLANQISAIESGHVSQR